MNKFVDRFQSELLIVKKTILKLLERCNPSHDCNPIIILLHHPKFYDHDIIYDYRRIYFNKFINNIKKQSPLLNYIDSSNIIDPNEPKNYAPAGSHFSPHGYRLIAEIILEKLK